MPTDSKQTLARILLLAGVLASPAHAEEKPASEQLPERAVEDTKGIYSVAYENDIFAGGQDNNYTNGVRFSYFSPESDVPNWLENTANAIPFFEKEGHKRWGIAFGQNMYTPNDITIPTNQPDDQPYAGFLYGTATVTSDTGTTLDTFQVTLGVVGPSSFAEDTQRFVHDVVGSEDPRGWDNQLKDEPGLILSYERKWRSAYEASPFSNWQFDVTPTAAANVGNIYTNATVGTIFRFGQDLPDDYGPPLISPNLSGSDFFIPTSDFGWYFFGGVQGQAVARNIFLDGNTWKDSNSVDKRPFVGGIQGGIAFTFNDTRVAYTHVMRTEQFYGQRENEQYGSINISYRF
jgi:lipid A 3-O-deacylase